MYDIVGIGELLIDFTPFNKDDITGFSENPGGAPCNMLIMAQNLGSKTAFIGKVGNDQFGKRLGQVLIDHHIETKGLVYSEVYPTTLAFVHLNKSGERSFSFYRKGCADVMLEFDEVDQGLLEHAKAVHFGSLSFTDEPSRSTVEKVIRKAKADGKLITYDPNYRPLLWNTVEEAIDGMKKGLKYADVIKVSDEEAALLTGTDDIEKAGSILLEEGVKLVCITLGGEGSYFAFGKGAGYVEGYSANVVDTTGAGDSFFGAVVHQIVQKNCKIDELEIDEVVSILNKANCAASLCIEGYGGIPSIPTEIQIKNRMIK